MPRPGEPSGPAPASLFQPAFTAGILDPSLWFRSDLAKWRSGLAQCENFIVRAQGGVINRPGTQFIGAAASTAAQIRLVPFIFDISQTYVLEMGDHIIRIITAGAYLTNPDGSIYSVATPYVAGDLPGLRWAQSNDVLTFTHPSYPPYELQRLGTLDWTFTAEVFGSQIAAPVMTPESSDGNSGSRPVNGNAGNTGTTPGVSSVDYLYAVTAVSESLASESVVSAGQNVTNYNISYYNQYGNYNILVWSAVAGADYYKVYRQYQGVWCFIGSTTQLSFDDTNILPDTTTGPPADAQPFANGNYPACVTYFQQRKLYAGSNQYPQTIWASRSGAFTNFDVSNPVRDDDGITATIASQQANPIRHLVSMQDVLVMTEAGAWKLSSGSGNSAAVTPSAISVQPQVYSGAYEFVQPLVWDYDLLFVDSRGSKVKSLNYNYYAQVYTPTDLTSLAESLFYGYLINGWCTARAPFNIVWANRSDGLLLGMTYLKEQDVYAWHLHDVGGFVLTTISIPEQVDGVYEDAVYMAVVRTIGGQQAVYVERMHTRLLGPQNNDPTQAWFVDCGLQYYGAQVPIVMGLQHLAGQQVSGLADGVPIGPLTVSPTGTVSLPNPAARVTLGLPIIATLQTLPIDTGQPSLVGKRKRIARVYASLQNTMGAQVSVDGVTFRPLQAPWAATGSQGNTGIGTAVLEVNLPPNWDIYGQITVQQTLPLPCSVLGLDAELVVGS